MIRLPRNQILVGDAVERLRELPDASVDCVVTSPPYFRLRNYGHAGQVGLEEHVDNYLARIIEVCDQLARVLKATGVLWLNLADSYSRHPKHGAPEKSLVLAPERVALALVQRGWVLRNRVVWSKPNPMPTSVRDRLACTHETVFCFVRQRRYFFDLDAIREPHVSQPGGLTTPRRFETTRMGHGKYESRHREWAGPLAGKNDGLARARAEGRAGHPLGKNPGDVWRIPTGRYQGAHFATFPEALVTRPLLATCPVRTCRSCGRPWLQHAGEPSGPPARAGVAPSPLAWSSTPSWEPAPPPSPLHVSGSTGSASSSIRPTATWPSPASPPRWCGPRSTAVVVLPDTKEHTMQPTTNGRPREWSAS